ncbi:hypothetical protein [Thiolapillus sp.]
MKNMMKTYPFLFITLFLLATPLSADWFTDKLIDPQDGYLDASNWLATRTGFLPVPIIITEPAVGYGGGLALAFFGAVYRYRGGCW